MDISTINLNNGEKCYSNFLLLQERTAVLVALAEKARLTEELFNTAPGITCNPVQGAMYTFPRITLPQKAIVKAKVWSTHTSHHSNLLARVDYYMYKCGCVRRRKTRNRTCSIV